MSDDFTSADDLRLWVEQGVHEPSAEERIAEWERQRRREDLRYRQEVEEDERWAEERDRRRRRRNRRIVATGWLVVFALIAGLVARTLSQTTSEESRAWASAGGARERAWSGARPTPPADASVNPLGRPIAMPRQAGPFEFSAVQPGGDGPVAYDPCRPIRYVVNRSGEPDGADRLVEMAVERISEITGLQFEADGVTEESIPTGDREPFQLDRYGDRWAPVLISWTSPDETELLSGDVAGFGGSTSLTISDTATGGTTAVYVTGHVALDGPQIADIVRRDPAHEKAALAVVLHELAHVVGLDHVDDRTQLMNPVSVPGVDDFAAGDLRGLRQLGEGACVPQL